MVVFHIANNPLAALKTVLRIETHRHTIKLTAAFNPDALGM